MSYESRVEKPLPIYVPRDEQFEESKAGAFSFCRLKAVLHNLLPSLTTNISSKHDFTGFKHLDSLFSEGLLLNLGLHDELLKKLPQVVHKIQTQSQGLLKFDTPVIISSKSITLTNSLYCSSECSVYDFANIMIGCYVQRTSWRG